MALLKPEVAFNPAATQNGATDTYQAPTFVPPPAEPATRDSLPPPPSPASAALAAAISPPPAGDTALAPAVDALALEPAPRPAPRPASVPARRPAVVIDDGMDFLDEKIGFGSFPIIKLEQGDFEIGKDSLGTEFTARVEEARPKYLYRENVKSTKNLFYSYDKIMVANGEETVESRLRRWEAASIEWEVKGYVEVVVQVVGGPKDGTVALLSIPPASVPRFAGFRKTIPFTHPGNTILSVIMKCKKGAKITTGSGENFFPWDFEVLKALH